MRRHQPHHYQGQGKIYVVLLLPQRTTVTHSYVTPTLSFSPRKMDLQNCMGPAIISLGVIAGAYIYGRQVRKELESVGTQTLKQLRDERPFMMFQHLHRSFPLEGEVLGGHRATYMNNVTRSV